MYRILSNKFEIRHYIHLDGRQNVQELVSSSFFYLNIGLLCIQQAFTFKHAHNSSSDMA